MATDYWYGGAASVAQVDTVTPGSVTVGNVFNVTRNNKTVSFTATVATVANVTAGLAAAWSASAEPEFGELTFADNTTNVQITGPSDGTPFTISSNAAVGTGSGTPTLVHAAVTTPTGANHWDVAGDWSLNAVPVNTNDVVADNSAVDVLFGLNQSGVTLNSLTFGPGFTGNVGLPERNPAGYQEDRPTHLQIIPTVVNVNAPSSGRIKLDVGSTAATVNVVATGQSNDSEPAALLLKGTSTSNVVNVAGGSVGLAALPGEAFAAGTVRVGAGSGGRLPTLVGGSGATLTTLVQDGGSATLAAGATTVTKTDGTLTVTGSGAYTTLTNWGGLLDYQSSGTITNLVVGGSGTADFRSDPRARTVTNCTLYKGARLYDPYHTVTFTNGIVLVDCDLTDVTLEIGIGRTVTIG